VIGSIFPGLTNACRFRIIVADLITSYSQTTLSNFLNFPLRIKDLPLLKGCRLPALVLATLPIMRLQDGISVWGR
jgi:hypothetical protein